MDRKFYQKYFYPLCLAVFPILCTLLILPKNSIFGSEGDWFSQHLAIANWADIARLYPCRVREQYL